MGLLSSWASRADASRATLGGGGFSATSQRFHQRASSPQQASITRRPGAPGEAAPTRLLLLVLRVRVDELLASLGVEVGLLVVDLLCLQRLDGVALPDAVGGVDCRLRLELLRLTRHESKIL